MAWVDEIERFQVEVLRMTGQGPTDEIMRKIIREAIEKWDKWKLGDSRESAK